MKKDFRGKKERSYILLYFLITGLEKKQEPARQSIRPCHVDLVQECFHLKSYSVHILTVDGEITLWAPSPPRTWESILLNKKLH